MFSYLAQFQAQFRKKKKKSLPNVQNFVIIPSPKSYYWSRILKQMIKYVYIFFCSFTVSEYDTKQYQTIVYNSRQSLHTPDTKKNQNFIPHSLILQQSKEQVSVNYSRVLFEIIVCQRKLRARNLSSLKQQHLIITLANTFQVARTT